MKTIKELLLKAKEFLTIVLQKTKALWFNVKEKVKDFFKKYHVLLTVPITIALFVVSVPVLRWYDPTASIFDAGTFQILIVTPLIFFVILSVAWLAYKIIFGTHHSYLKNEMKTDFTTITSWQRQKLAYFIYFFLVALLAFIARIVS